MGVTEWPHTHGIHHWSIHHWRILWNSSRRLSKVGFEPKTTDFCSDALIDLAIRPWVQLALITNSVQLVQFSCFFKGRFVSGNVFASFEIYFSRSFSEVITWMAWIELLYMVFTIEGFFKVSIKIWWELDLNPRPLNSVQTI